VETGYRSGEYIMEHSVVTEVISVYIISALKSQKGIMINFSMSSPSLVDWI
jgi:hypothetical protein